MTLYLIRAISSPIIPKMCLNYAVTVMLCSSVYSMTSTVKSTD